MMAMASLTALSYAALSVIMLSTTCKGWVGENLLAIDLCQSIYSPQSGVRSDGSGQSVTPATQAWCAQVCQDDGKCVGFDLDDTSCTTYTRDQFNSNSDDDSNVQYTKINVCASVCHSSWTIYPDISAASSSLTYQPIPADNVTNCLEFCLRGTPDCVGIAYNADEQNCLYYTSSASSHMFDFGDDGDATLYVIDDRCAQSCSVTWPVTSSTQYTSVYDEYYSKTAKNADDCLNECVLDPMCTIITVTSESSSEPFSCQMAWNYDVNSATDNPDVDSYRFEETCPP